MNLVGFEALGEDEPEGVLSGVGAGGGEGELPGGSLFDVGVGFVGGGSSGCDGGGFGEGDSSVLAILGDDDILEEGFDYEFGGGVVVLGVADAVDNDGDVADGDAQVYLDQIGAALDGPGAVLKGTIAYRVPNP